MTTSHNNNNQGGAVTCNNQQQQQPLMQTTPKHNQGGAVTYNNRQQQQPFMPTTPKHNQGGTVISNNQQRHCSDLPEVVLRNAKKKEDTGKKPLSFSSWSGYRFSGQSPRPDPRFPAGCQVVVGPMSAGWTMTCSTCICGPPLDRQRAVGSPSCSSTRQRLRGMQPAGSSSLGTSSSRQRRMPGGRSGRELSGCAMAAWSGLPRWQNKTDNP